MITMSCHLALFSGPRTWRQLFASYLPLCSSDSALRQPAYFDQQVLRHLLGLSIPEMYKSLGFVSPKHPFWKVHLIMWDPAYYAVHQALYRSWMIWACVHPRDPVLPRVCVCDTPSVCVSAFANLIAKNIRSKKQGSVRWSCRSRYGGCPELGACTHTLHGML